MLIHRQRQQDEQTLESVTDKGDVTCTGVFFFVVGEALGLLVGAARQLFCSPASSYACWKDTKTDAAGV